MAERAQASRAVLIGATGAVGRNVLDAVLHSPHFIAATTLGRRKLPADDPLAASQKLTEHVVDLAAPESYKALLGGHDTAFCTLGVGQPSKMPESEVRRIEVDTVLAFAAACKERGVCHFTLMTSVGSDRHSRVKYLRMKAELEQGVADLGFARCTLARPSMLLTPENRYGASQGVLLAVWPRLDFILGGPLRKYRGISVRTLGQALVRNAERLAPPGRPAAPVEILEWDDFTRLTSAAGLGVG